MEALRSLSRLLWGPSPSLGPAPSPGPAPSLGPAPIRGPAPGPARPFWVSPAGGEGRPRGVVAATLAELRQQARWALALPLPPALALAEDGTLVEDEEFFGTLPPHAALQALGPGQRWEPPQAPPSWDLGRGLPGGPPELARLSLLAPGGDARGLRLQARLRGLRWELGGLGPDALLRQLLRLLLSLSRALGQALLGLSAALRPLLDGPQTHVERH